MNWNLISILLLLPSLSRSAPKPHDGIHVKSEDDIYIAEIDVHSEQGDNLTGNEVRVPEEQIPEIDEDSSKEDQDLDEDPAENKDKIRNKNEDPAVDKYEDLDEDPPKEGIDEHLEDENPAEEDKDEDLSEDQDFQEDDDKNEEKQLEGININIEEKNLPEKNNAHEDHLAKTDGENGDLLGIAKDEQKGIDVKVELENLSGIAIQAEGILMNSEENNPPGIDIMTIEKKSDEEDISNIGVKHKDENLQESGTDSSDRLSGIDAITEDKSVTGTQVILENNSPSEINAKTKDEQTIVIDPLSVTDQNAKDDLTEIELFDTHAKTLDKIHLSVETEKEPLSKVEVKSEDEILPELRVTATDKDLSKNGVKSNENHATGMDFMNNDLSGVDIKAKEELALKNNAKGVVENLSNNEHTIPQDNNLVDIDIKVKEDGQSDIDKMINGVFEENEQNLPNLDLKAESNNPANIDKMINGVFEENEQNLPNIDLKAESNNPANIDKMIISVFEENEQNLLNIELIDQDKNLAFIDEMINGVFEEDLESPDFEIKVQDENQEEIDTKAKDASGINEMIDKVYKEEEEIVQIQEADPQSPASADSIVTSNDNIKKAEDGELGVLMTRLMGMIGLGESAEVNPTKSESKTGEELFSKNDVKTNEDLDGINATVKINQKDDEKPLTKLDGEPTINKKTSELELTKRAGIFVKSLFDMMGLGDSVKTSQSSTCAPSSPLYYADLNDTLCKKFYHCSDGHSPYLQECPNGTRWAPKLHTCDYEDNVPCPRTTSADIIVARCEFKGEGTGGVFGEVIIVQEIAEENAANGSRFQGKIIGLSPGLHGFHVHAKGDLGDDCKAAGGHFNPEGVIHGRKDGDVRHVGDLGNLEAGEDGAIMLDVWDQVALLEGDNSIIGKAIVVHEGRDDEGEGGNEGSLLHGNAGSRAGCCRIQKV